MDHKKIQVESYLAETSPQALALFWVVIWPYWKAAQSREAAGSGKFLTECCKKVQITGLQVSFILTATVTSEFGSLIEFLFAVFHSFQMGSEF